MSTTPFPRFAFKQKCLSDDDPLGSFHNERSSQLDDKILPFVGEPKEIKIEKSKKPNKDAKSH
ncbi:hypothetical protein Tco_0743133, partial [Tanacetum coccineum]